MRRIERPELERENTVIAVDIVASIISFNPPDCYLFTHADMGAATAAVDRTEKAPRAGHLLRCAWPAAPPRRGTHPNGKEYAPPAASASGQAP